MLELKGKYCKDCKIFTDNIEQEALSMVYPFNMRDGLIIARGKGNEDWKG